MNLGHFVEPESSAKCERVVKFENHHFTTIILVQDSGANLGGNLVRSRIFNWS